MRLSPSAFCFSPLHLLCSYLSAFHFQLFYEFPFPPPLPHLQIPLTHKKDSHKANVMAGGTGWGCRGRNLASLEAMKTKRGREREKWDLRQGRSSADSEAMRTFLGAEGTQPFCMRHQPELSHFVGKLFTIQMLNRTCSTGPLLAAGIHDLHSTASYQSKVFQSTVMSCLTDSSDVRTERELDHSLFSRF